MSFVLKEKRERLNWRITYVNLALIAYIITLHSDPLHNNSTYSHLAVLTKEFLSICASSCPSECLFSTSSCIITHRRGRLVPKTISALMTLKTFHCEDHTYWWSWPKNRRIISKPNWVVYSIKDVNWTYRFLLLIYKCLRFYLSSIAYMISRIDG